MTNNPTTQSLIEQLLHPDLGVRRQAALTLGASGDPAAAPALVERLGAEESACVREDVTWATVQLIDAALPRVLALLRSPESAERRQAAHVLSKVGDPAHLGLLLPLVDDAHADVAIKAYRAVASTGDPDALGALAGRLGDGDALQRDALTAAFHRFGELAVPVLVGALADPDADVREHAADALGHLGVEADAAVDALASLAGDPVAAVRLAAVAALGQLGPVADGALEAVASGGDRTLASVAARLLGGRTGRDSTGSTTGRFAQPA